MCFNVVLFFEGSQGTFDVTIIAPYTNTDGPLKGNHKHNICSWIQKEPKITSSEVLILLWTGFVKGATAAAGAIFPFLLRGILTTATRG